jgi:hypothetical protein
MINYKKKNNPLGVLKSAERYQYALKSNGPTEGGKLPRPTYAMYLCTIWAFGQLRMPERALQLLDELPQSGHQRTPQAWKYYFEACGRLQDPERLRRAIHAMELDQVPWTQETFEAALLGYFSSAEFQRGNHIWNRFKQGFGSSTKTNEKISPLGVSFQGLSQVLRIFMRANRVQETAKILLEHRDHLELGPITWIDAVKFFAQNNHVRFETLQVH